MNELDGNDPRHGTTRGYHAGCHDACCRAAMARYEKEGRLARLRGGRAVLAIGAQRRLQGLMRLGWSSHAIAEAAGLRHRNHVWRIINGQKGRPTVWLQRSTDAWVRDIYDQLSMQIPEGRYVARTRNHAERMGWPPPLAWDDIDNPDEKPRGLPTPTRKEAAELTVADWDMLRRLGYSRAAAAEYMGISKKALEKAIERTERRMQEAS